MTEWNAAEYVRRSGLQEAMAEEVLGLLDLKGSERILDVGCGDGRVTARIAARVPDGTVVGVDASREMIGFASSRFDAANHPNLRFEAADARELPFQEEFDLVVSFNALHWIPDQHLAFRSIRSAMKTDGQAELRLVPKGERKSLEDVLEETRSSQRWMGYFRDFHDPYLHLTPEQYAALAEENGLRVRKVNTKSNAWDFQSREAFFAFGSVTFIEWTRRLPESERPAFITEVLDRYQPIATGRPGEENMFKFYQMDITLTRNDARSEGL